MERKYSEYLHEKAAPIPRRVRDLRVDCQHNARPVLKRKRKRHLPDPSPLSLPSIPRPPRCLRLPHISSNLHSHHLSHFKRYNVLPPISREPARDMGVSDKREAEPGKGRGTTSGNAP